jgi:RNA polymerase sigma factor for flagellar operon FliA
MVEFTPQGRLWARYRTTNDPRTHERLINEYAPLVGYVAGRLRAHLPPHMDESDLNQWGLLGLIDAIARFDPTRAIRFETFAMTRIRGAIIDELRGLDWVPRSVRTRARQVERAIAEIERQKGATATDAEVAEYLGITPETLDATFVDISRGSMMALDDAFVGTGTPDTIALIDVLADTSASSPTQVVSQADRTAAIDAALEQLPERERLVVRLYYFDEMTLKEIAKILNVSESRASQLHSKGILRLRARLADDTDRVLETDA